MKKPLLFSINFLLLISHYVVAQIASPKNYIGLRAGYLRASTDLSTSSSNVVLRGIADRNSFYAGAFLHHNLTRYVAYRLEVNYQQKGIENQNQFGDVWAQRRFHYVGLTPLLGFTPLKGLGVYVGPEANLRVGKNPFGSSQTRIETGISGRLSYRYKWIGAEVGYFRAFNEFTTFNLGSDVRFGFTNRTWQVGLLFVPNQLIKGNRTR